MNKILFPCISLFLFFLLFFFAPAAYALEQSGRYVTVYYADKKLLHGFNDRLILGRRLAYILRKQNPVTVRDEVLAKIDIVIEKAEVVLDMFPDNLHINLVLLPSSDAVDAEYKRKYGKNVNYISYYSLSEKTIYMSVEDMRLQVLAHEIGHAIVDHYFKVRPPYAIHELMAQFTEKHITD